MKLRRLLVVEDDDAYRERMAVAFRRRGIEVRAAADAGEAAALTAGWDFDGAVVDLKMPIGSGLDVIRELRARCSAARLVVLTGYGSIATALTAVQLGAADYLTKPADADQILAALLGKPRRPENPKEVPMTTPSLDRVEWEHMHRVLQDCGGNISQAARMLGLDRRSLQRKLGKHPPSR